VEHTAQPADGAGTTLHARLLSTLSSLLPSGTRAALINYPNHHNAGDAAIYLGTLRALHRIGVRVTYRCQAHTYSPESLRQQLRAGTEAILINGGGNLGDQYPQQIGRERVLRDFPDVPTIQLPQSIWFESDGRLAEFAALVRHHRALTLLVRDQDSLALAQRQLEVETRLCPDMAFGLGRLRRPSAATQPIMWLRRTDREAGDSGHGSTVSAGQLAPGVEPEDWLAAAPEVAVGDSVGVALMRANWWLAGRVEEHPTLWRPLAWTFAPLAQRRLDFGLRLLSRGGTVVTDRLHGVILALLMGIPVVAVDNRNGKVASFIETWLSDRPDVALAAGHSEALRTAAPTGRA
jgi:exopolysaccharide biosynthesis predicted pyruvyltransferase EpsI